jgi:hypothetical protein
MVNSVVPSNSFEQEGVIYCGAIVSTAPAPLDILLAHQVSIWFVRLSPKSLNGSRIANSGLPILQYLPDQQLFRTIILLSYQLMGLFSPIFRNNKAKRTMIMIIL